MARVCTKLAVLDVAQGRFIPREKVPDLDLSSLQVLTDERLHCDGPVRDLVAPAL